MKMKKKNKRGEIGWGIIYGIAGLILSIVIVKGMNPPFFWKLLTILVTTVGAFIAGHLASG